MKGPVSEPCITGSGFRIQEAQKHTDPTDPAPDPQHGLKAYPLLR